MSFPQDADFETFLLRSAQLVSDIASELQKIRNDATPTDATPVVSPSLLQSVDTTYGPPNIVVVPKLHYLAQSGTQFSGFDMEPNNLTAGEPSKKTVRPGTPRPRAGTDRVTLPPQFGAGNFRYAFPYNETAPPRPPPVQRNLFPPNYYVGVHADGTAVPVRIEEPPMNAIEREMQQMMMTPEYTVETHPSMIRDPTDAMEPTGPRHMTDALPPGNLEPGNLEPDSLQPAPKGAKRASKYESHENHVTTNNYWNVVRKYKSLPLREMGITIEDLKEALKHAGKLKMKWFYVSSDVSKCSIVATHGSFASGSDVTEESDENLFTPQGLARALMTIYPGKLPMDFTVFRNGLQKAIEMLEADITGSAKDATPTEDAHQQGGHQRTKTVETLKSAEFDRASGVMISTATFDNIRAAFAAGVPRISGPGPMPPALGAAAANVQGFALSTHPGSAAAPTAAKPHPAVAPTAAKPHPATTTGAQVPASRKVVKLSMAKTLKYLQHLSDHVSSIDDMKKGLRVRADELAQNVQHLFQELNNRQEDLNWYNMLITELEAENKELRAEAVARANAEKMDKKEDLKKELAVYKARCAEYERAFRGGNH
ncbi:hypothetical protein NA57DRAFT_77985 [Rhizodiscina lignyota]|uniref:Uncharacterized protein n=1 Tax=Rhizodiscina lignyota TaxID=1504668 RepID=A0A9P4ICD5_9PEZI|nr:hypothetical protein NA57DRAFT_77985 [Rhizodiscina lignyota]